MNGKEANYGITNENIAKRLQCQGAKDSQSKDFHERLGDWGLGDWLQEKAGGHQAWLKGILQEDAEECMMIRVKDTELLQENVIGLVEFANEHRFIDLDGAYESETVQSFVEIFTKGCQEPLTRRELEDLVTGVQAFIRLPVYTTNQAAAWLGVGIDTIREAVWRQQKIKIMKPGHDVLVPHSELVKYLEN